MRIGIFSDALPNQGGVYQYTQSVLEAVSDLDDIEPVLISTDNKTLHKLRQAPEIEYKPLNLPIPFKYFYKVINFLTPQALRLTYKTPAQKIVEKLHHLASLYYIRAFKSLNLDLIIFTVPTNFSHYLDTPFAVSVHDLNHRINPQFPEVRDKGRWFMREYNYSRIASEASLIFVDSSVGKQNLLDLYEVKEEKVQVLPYLPPTYLQIQSDKQATALAKEMQLPEKYFFYPAKFWPHKNHLNLLEALNILHQQNQKIHLVLTGSKNAACSTYDHFWERAKMYELSDYIHHLGYISSKKISVVYQMALGLVMPTFFGPTNIPVLEAWKLKTPVITSNILGCKQQVGEAGLLVDPNSSLDISKKMERLASDSELREKLIKKGTDRLSRWSEENFVLKIKNSIRHLLKSSYASKKNRT